MFNLNKVLLSILVISGLTVQTTQPIGWNWITNNTFYKKGEGLCSYVSKTQAYKTCTACIDIANAYRKTAIAAVCLGACALYKCYTPPVSKKEHLKTLLTKTTRQNDSKKRWETLSNIGGLVENNEYDVNTQTAEGITALYLAAKDGYLDIVTKYMDQGANPHLKTKDGQTSFDAANMIEDISLKAKTLDQLRKTDYYHKEIMNNRKQSYYCRLLTQAYRDRDAEDKADRITEIIQKEGLHYLCVEDKKIVRLGIYYQEKAFENLKRWSCIHELIDKHDIKASQKVSIDGIEKNAIEIAEESNYPEMVLWLQKKDHKSLDYRPSSLESK